MVRVRVVQAVYVPAPVGGQLRDRIGTRCDQLPQRVGARHPAWEPAAHRDDRHRFPVDRHRGRGRDWGRRSSRALPGMIPPAATGVG